MFGVKPVFLFYSQSADVPAGKGAGETIDPADDRYRELNTIPNWRRILSNFSQTADDTILFELDDICWHSVEHYFHAQKFKKKDPSYYFSFALDSESTLSRGDGATVKRAGRAVKLTAEEIRTWDNISADVLVRAQRAKFTQNSLSGRVLKLTAGATLTHRAGRFSPVVVEHRLMGLRDELIADGKM